MILMSTHNVFLGEITKIIPKLLSDTLLICSTGGTGYLPEVAADIYSTISNPSWPESFFDSSDFLSDWTSNNWAARLGVSENKISISFFFNFVTILFCITSV